MRKIVGILLVLFLCVGCAGSFKKESSEKLTIGVMPSMDSAPILWAKEKGLFEKAGLDVEIIVYTNGNDRDTQIQTKAVDAVVTDIMGLVAMKEAGYEVSAVSQTNTLFSIITKPGAMDKEALKVAMAEVSVTQFAADQGLTKYTVSKEFVDALPQRLEMVGQGLVDGAIIPEPMASLSSLKGLDNTSLDLTSPNVLMFQNDTLKNNEAGVKVFYKVYNEAVIDMMKDEDALKDVIISKLGLDAAIKPVMRFPTYESAAPVDEAVFDSVVAWMKTTLNMNPNVKYQDVVNTTFLND